MTSTARLSISRWISWTLSLPIGIIVFHRRALPLPLLLPAKMIRAGSDILELAGTLWESLNRVLPIDPSKGQRSLISGLTVWKETCLVRSKNTIMPIHQLE